MYLLYSTYAPIVFSHFIYPRKKCSGRLLISINLTLLQDVKPGSTIQFTIVKCLIPNNYKLYQKDHADGYGGVLVGIKKEFQPKLVNTDTDSEIGAVKDKTSASTSDRPPNRDIDNHQSLCNIIHNIATMYSKHAIYCAGDLNLPDICWTN